MCVLVRVMMGLRGRLRGVFVRGSAAARDRPQAPPPWRAGALGAIYPHTTVVPSRAKVGDDGGGD